MMRLSGFDPGGASVSKPSMHQSRFKEKQQQIYMKNRNKSVNRPSGSSLSGGNYTIQSGDTLSGIGQRYGIDWQKILQANPGINPRTLQIGSRIKIPGYSGGSHTSSSHHTSHLKVSRPTVSVNSGTAKLAQQIKKATGQPYNPDNLIKKYESKINNIYDQRKKSQLAQYNAAKQKALNKINTQIQGVRSDFQNKRNQADVSNLQAAQKLKEIMAANGLSGSGENVTANVALQNQRQNDLNTLNQQQAQNVGQLQNQIANINNPSHQQVIVSNIEADRAAALAKADQLAQDQAWRQYQYNNMSALQKANLAQNASQFGQDMAWKMYANQQQIAAQNAQNQAQIDMYRSMLNGNFNTSSGGGGSYQSDLAQAMQRDGMPASQVPYFNWVIQHESSFNPNAQNPNSTAHGYGQFLDSTVKNMDKRTGLHYNSSPVDQLIETYQYMKDRYGSPAAAEAFWKAHHWY